MFVSNFKDKILEEFKSNVVYYVSLALVMNNILVTLDNGLRIDFFKLIVFY